MTVEGGDGTGNWVFNDIAARVDRAGPHPVSEDHNPGLVHPEVNWLINNLAKINSTGQPDSVIIRHAREIMYYATALRARSLGPVNLVGDIENGFTTAKRSTKPDGLAKELRRLSRAAQSAVSGSPTRWVKAWAAASLECRRLVWQPERPSSIRHEHDLNADEIGPRKVGFSRAKLTNLGIEGRALIGPKPEDALPKIESARRALSAQPANERQGNKSNEQADALADAIRAAVLDLCGRITITDDRIAGKVTGPLADFGSGFDDKFGTAIRWRLIEKSK
jgi:hypothetical protein